MPRVVKSNLNGVSAHNDRHACTPVYCTMLFYNA